MYVINLSSAFCRLLMSLCIAISVPAQSVTANDLAPGTQESSFETVLIEFEAARRRADGSSESAGVNLLRSARSTSLEAVGSEAAQRAAQIFWRSGEQWLSYRFFRHAILIAIQSRETEAAAAAVERYLDLLLLDNRFAIVADEHRRLIPELEELGIDGTTTARLNWYLGEAFRELGEPDRAVLIFRQAREVIGAVDDANIEEFVKNRMALASVSTNLGGTAILASAIADVQTVTEADAHPEFEAQLFSELAWNYAERGELELAQEAVGVAERLRPAISEETNLQEAVSQLNTLATRLRLAASAPREFAPLQAFDENNELVSAISRFGPLGLINYRTRRFQGVYLNVRANDTVQNGPGSLQRQDADPIFRYIERSADPDPLLRLQYLRARAFAQAYEQQSFGVLTEAIDNWLSFERDGDAVVAPMIADQFALSSLVFAPELAAAPIGEGARDSTIITRALQPLGRLAVDLAARREEQTTIASAPLFFGGLSWYYYNLRGGSGSPSTIAYPLYLEMLDRARTDQQFPVSVDEEAFATLQLATRTALSSVAERQIQIAQLDDRRLASRIDERQRIEGRVRLTRQAVFDALRARDRSSFSSATQELDSLSERSASLDSRINGRTENASFLLQNANVNLLEAQASLAPDEALILLYGGSDIPPPSMASAAVRSAMQNYQTLAGSRAAGQSVFIAVLTNEEFHWEIADISALALTVIVRRLRCQLDYESCPAGTNDDQFDGELAHELYQLLIEPLESTIGGRTRLHLIAPGVLSTIPLSVLWTEYNEPAEQTRVGYEGAPWLIRRYALDRIPTVSTLLNTANTRRNNRQSDRFVGFGDPDLQTLPPGAPSLPRLTFSGAEIAAVASSFPARRSSVFLGLDATENRVREVARTPAALTVFSTHGLPAGSWPTTNEPGLVFTRDPTDISDDGFLSSSEVLELQLTSRWVILSACRTAASDGSALGDSFAGLARSFLFAGASAVMVTNWDVRDDIAAAVVVGAVERFREFPEEGRAAAVRHSVLAVVDDPDDASRSDPSIWAPFSLISGSE